MRRPNSIIGYTTALAFVLAGCAINIEPTDLSAVIVENDRTVIEKTLGKPDEVVEAQGFTVASYSYDTGFYRPARGTCCGSSAPSFVIGLLLLPVVHAVRTSEAKAQQKGQLAAIFDGDDKLVFVRSLDESEPTSDKLISIATRYAEAQSGNAAAFIDLSELTLIPGQKQTFLETAANSGSAEAAFELGEAYRLGAGVEQNDAEAVQWWLTAGRQDYVPAYKQLGKAYQAGTGVERARFRRDAVRNLASSTCCFDCSSL